MELALENGFMELTYNESQLVEGGDVADVAYEIGKGVGFVAGAAYNVLEFIYKVTMQFGPIMLGL